MFAHPGKKLLFMGNDFAQSAEWNHDVSLDWHLLEYAPHSGVQALVRDLNSVYRNTPALHQVDFADAGFEWIDWGDRDNSVFSWIRRDASGGFVVCVVNMTPVVREGYRIGVPEGGPYRTLVNTDNERYGGSGQGADYVVAQDSPQHGRPCSLELTLPPLATLILEKD
jgi:1,4-alpha-glucan branching enzyme